METWDAEDMALDLLLTIVMEKGLEMEMDFGLIMEKDMARGMISDHQGEGMANRSGQTH